MSKSALVTVAAVFIVGCTNLQGGASLPPLPMPMPMPMPRDIGEVTSVQTFELSVFTRPARCGVNVYVDEDNSIAIDHEPVHTKRCVGSVRTILWKLDPADSSLTFPSNGIELKSAPAAGDPICGLVTASAGKKFACTFSGSPTGNMYRYTITVLRNGVALLPLDPTIINN